MLLSPTASHDRRSPKLKCSDHKPVSAAFDTSCKAIVETKRDAVKKSLIAQLDSWENQSIPKIELSVNNLVFNNVGYDT